MTANNLNTYSDGFPKDILAAINFSNFLDEKERQEWLDWYPTSDLSDQADVVNTLHQLWLKDRADDQNISHPDNVSVPNPVFDFENETAMAQSSTPTNQFGGFASPVQPSPLNSALPPFSSATATQVPAPQFEPQIQFSPNPNFNPAVEPTPKSIPVPPTPPKSETPTTPNTFNDFTFPAIAPIEAPKSLEPKADLEDKVEVVTNSNDEYDYASELLKINKEADVEPLPTQQTDSVELDHQIELAPAVKLPEVVKEVAPEPIQTQTPIQETRPKASTPMTSPTPPAPKPSAPKPVAVTTQPALIPTPPRKLNEESLKNSSFESNPILNKPSHSSTRAGADIEQLYKHFLDTQNQTVEFEREYKDRQAQLFAKIMGIVTQATELGGKLDETHDKIMKVNEKVVSQAKITQELSNSIQIRPGSNSMQSQVNNLKDEMKKMERSFSYDLETLSSDLAEFRTEMNAKYNDLSVQMAGALADNYLDGNGIQSNINKLVARIQALESKQNNDYTAKLQNLQNRANVNQTPNTNPNKNHLNNPKRDDRDNKDNRSK